jgi:8-oxo-dGTP pyrophosphatase MutT (NUDIX family)
MTVPLRDAATVMLVRDARNDGDDPAIEVCMLRRNLASEFVAGAYVFPGGAVDPADRAADVEALCRGRSDADASAVLNMDSGGLALWVAALRECFEEAGVLVAQSADGAPNDLLDLSEPEVTARFETYRQAVNDGTMGLLEVCRAEGLVLVTDDVHYVSHWITPELAPKRYDTRFFVTDAPPGQVAHHDEGETIATIWVKPADALARCAAGEIELLPPTIANLEALAVHSSAADVMAWARQVTDVPTILPIVLMEDGNLLVLRPGDVGYKEALEDRMAASGSVSPELAQAAKEAWGPKAGNSFRRRDLPES